jgi:pimeloyl-ACP methyl ester carboxylesterase
MKGEIDMSIHAAISEPAQRPGLPPGFEGRMVATPGGDLFVQLGGTGSPVVLLHGYVHTGDMWGPLAADLAQHHTLIVPDLRGIGRSSPGARYDKKTQAQDIRALVEALGFDKAALVGHDLGSTVAYAYAAQYPTKVSRLVFMEAPLPGVDPWDEIVKMPVLWHFHFGGPEAERLVEGRERIYFDRFWNDAAVDPSKIADETRDHYAAQYAAPGVMGAGFAQFAAFSQDAEDNATLARTKLEMPVLAIGGETGFGPLVATTLRNAAAEVHEAIIPGATVIRLR